MFTVGVSNQHIHLPSPTVTSVACQTSPASRAGLRKDDLIVRMAGSEIPNFVAFRRQLIGLRPGETLALTLYRDGSLIEVESTLADRPGDQ